MEIKERSIAHQLQVAVENNNHLEFSILLSKLNDLDYETISELCQRVFMDKEMACKLDDQEYYFGILVDIIENYYEKDPSKYIEAVVKGFSGNFYAEGFTTLMLNNIKEKDIILKEINKLDIIDQDIFQNYLNNK